MKGTVTGQVAGLGLKPSADAYSVAILVDRTSGETLGIDSTTPRRACPSRSGCRSRLNDITPGSDYVVTAEVVNADETWRNTEGVPVITNGNSRSGIQVVVAEVVAPSPSAARCAPRPTPSGAHPGRGLEQWRPPRDHHPGRTDRWAGRVPHRARQGRQ